MPDTLSPRRAAALGVVQGACELMPVSSSAHIALLARDLPFARRRTLEVALHGGTALVLPWVVRDVAARVPRKASFHLAALAPPVLVGVLGADLIERRAAGPRAIAAGLLLGSASLLAGDRVVFSRRYATRNRQARDAGARDGLAVGIAQAVSLLPGVSRRGATLAAARGRGFDRAAASDLSWTAGGPVMLAAAIRGLTGSAGRGELRHDAPALAAGAAAAALTVAALSPARRAIDQVPSGVWVTWRCALAVAAGTLQR